MKLLLFDIDGTLLTTQEAGRAAVERVLSDLTNRPVSAEGFSFSGKTDPQIMHEILRAHGAKRNEADALVPKALDAYAALSRKTLSEDEVAVLAGVEALLAHLHEEPVVQLGLLTGNIESMAHLKLELTGLHRYFSFGAFGSDAADRNELPAVALRRAETHTNQRFAGEDVCIIGDTEHDIQCGRGIGATSIAVCTGRYDRNDLAPHAPDLLLDDLAESRRFLEHILPASAPKPLR